MICQVFGDYLTKERRSEIGGLGDGEIAWHSDQSYKRAPGTGAILYGVEVPDSGAATYFANLRLAYAALSDREATDRRLPCDLRLRSPRCELLR